MSPPEPRCPLHLLVRFIKNAHNDAGAAPTTGLLHQRQGLRLAKSQTDGLHSVTSARLLLSPPFPLPPELTSHYSNYS